jgi:hypothetical protein
MTNLLNTAFDKAQGLPDYLQNEIAEQVIEGIENELQWQKTLQQQQPIKLEKLATKALKDSIDGKTKLMGFDEL